MKVVYARISTPNQNQERQMKQDGTKVYLDICSGTIPFAERTEGAKLLKAKDITQIEVAAVDRLGRNLTDILKTLEHFTSKGIDIYIKNQGLHTMVDGKPNPTATMIIQIMGTIAEFERNTIKERTAQGIAIAKAKGRYKGRKRGANAQIESIRTKHAEKIQVIQSCINEGRSLKSIADEYNYNRGLIYRLIEKGLVEKS
jgi:DNA invertase Pin-like site-specific DNA recombinase